MTIVTAATDSKRQARKGPRGCCALVPLTIDLYLPGAQRNVDASDPVRYVTTMAVVMLAMADVQVLEISNPKGDSAVRRTTPLG